MRRARGLAAVLAALGTLALGAPSAGAASRDGFVTSFDQTKIVYSFFPARGLAAGRQAATVMNGPGYSSGRAKEDDPTVDGLLDAGYNVLTWDPRGFGDSGGNVEIDSREYEARDVQALMDYLAKQPEVQLDAPGDPRLGMAGSSYGAGIQNNAAIVDPRIDVITPSIGWHSLVTSLDKSNTAKGGWGSLLFGLGINGTTTSGVTGGLTGEPAGFQFGRMQDPKAQAALANGAATGEFTEADQAFFASRGPGELIGRVRIPTLITQGTNDTLFTLHEAIENYRAQRAAGTDVAMIWFCGGLSDPSVAHGVCNTALGPDPSIVLHASLRWLDKHLRGRNVDTGPRFQWVSDTGVLHSAADYPVPTGAPLTGSGSGTLAMVAGSTSGALIEATRATNAVNVPLAKPAAGTQLLGEPTLTLDYSGLAPSSNGRVYAQLVDDKSGLVLGNQVTPVPVTLDGKPHTTTLPLEGIAIDAVAGSSYTLQVTDGSNVYFGARRAGAVTLSKVSVNVPTVAQGASAVVKAAPPVGSPGAAAAPCERKRITFRVRAPHGRAIVRAKLYVDGRLTVTRRGRRLTRLRLVPPKGTRSHVIRIDTFTRRGGARRSTRTLSGCKTSKPRTVRLQKG